MVESSYTTSLVLDAPASAVIEAIQNVRAWWGEDVVGSADEVGATFIFQGDNKHRVTLRVAELVPDTRIVWHVLDNRMTFVADQSGWIGTDVVFELESTGDGTRLTFTHEGLAPSHECYEVCQGGWNYFINGSLPELVCTGAGTPLRISVPAGSVALAG